VEPALRRVRIRRRCRPRRLAGDKGYSHGFVRRYLWRRGIRPVIPRRVDQLHKPGRPARFDRRSYRRRNVIERSVNWLKENRRLGTRYDKLAASFLCFAQLAIIQRYFRILRL
jgi:transposase